MRDLDLLPPGSSSYVLLVVHTTQYFLHNFLTHMHAAHSGLTETVGEADWIPLPSMYTELKHPGRNSAFSFA